MCTYLTEKVSISGSGKGPSGWFKVTDASVYFDHPVHAQAEHTLNIDFLDPGAGACGARRGRAHRRIGARPGQGDHRHPGLRSARPDHLPPAVAARSLGTARPGNVGASCEYLCEGGSALARWIGQMEAAQMEAAQMEAAQMEAAQMEAARMEAAGMRFVVERDALAEAVAWVARSLPSRPVLPILSGLLLAAESGGLTLSCFDYEVSARIRIDADVAEPGTVLVPGRLLAEITRSLPGHPIEVDDADDVTLTCGAASFSLVTLPLGEYPRLPELPRLAGTVDGGALATAISQVTPAASRDDTLPVITGVNVEIAGDTITLVATDRYRLAIRELGWDPARSDVSSTLLVPAKTLADAARMMAPGVPVRILTRGTETARVRAELPGRSGRLAAGRRRHDRLRVGRTPADHAPDRGGVHQVQLQVPRGLRQPGRHAGRAAGRGGPAGGAGRRAGQFGPALVRAGEGHHRGGHQGAGAGAGDGGRRLLRRGVRDRVQPALPARRPGRGAGRGRATPQPRPKKDGDDAADPVKGKRDGAAPKTQGPQGPQGPQGRKEEGCIRLEFTSPTKPALITASPRPGEESVPDYRYLVVPLRALTDA